MGCLIRLFGTKQRRKGLLFSPDFSLLPLLRFCCAIIIRIISVQGSEVFPARRCHIFYLLSTQS